MSCTKEEFQKKVRSKYPHKWMGDGAHGNPHTQYALDTRGECELSSGRKYELASHVWSNGTVIKDSDGLFDQDKLVDMNNGTVTVTLPSPPHNYTYKIYRYGQPSQPIHIGVDYGFEEQKCKHSWKTYDSGWSKYEYCEKCNVKENA